MDNLAESTVYSTNDYDKFKKIQGNRLEAKSHIRHLIQSYEVNPDLARTRPILVTKAFEIIDGQHRFEASRALGLPVYYMIGHNIDIRTARHLNAIQRSWNLQDYMNSFISTGEAQYVKLAELLEEYPIPLGRMLHYCSGSTGHVVTRQFKSGTFKIMKDKELLLYRLGVLKEMEQYIEFWNDGYLAAAMLTIFKNNYEFDADRFIAKLKGANMQKQANTSDFLREIERVYNWHQPDGKNDRLF